MKSIITTFLIIIEIAICAQTHDNDHDDDVHSAIGIANTAVYSINEQAIADGLHVHLIKGISHKFGMGIGYEIILSEHKHQSVSILAKYIPHKRVSINIGPGIAFPNKEHDEYSFLAHLEIVSVFYYKKFHYGPMLGFGGRSEDQHISLGLHIAYGL